MYWDANLETLNPAAVQELQLSRLRQTVERAAHSPFYGRRLQGGGRCRRQPPVPGGYPPDSFYHQRRPAGPRPGDADPAADRHGAAPRLLRDHGPGHGDLLHPRRYRDLGRSGGPLPVHGRDAGRGRVSEHDGLRPVHRGAGVPLRRRTAGGPDHPRRAPATASASCS